MFIPDPYLDIFPIPDPGVKKAPDPGSGLAKLFFCLLFRVSFPPSTSSVGDPKVLDIVQYYIVPFLYVNNTVLV
jgi:hypothetical protein